MKKDNLKIIVLAFGGLISFALINDFFRRKLSETEFTYYCIIASILLIILWYLLFKKAIKNKKQKSFLLFTLVFSIVNILIYFIIK